MSIKGKPTKSLLDSGSEVTLMNESYYKEHIEHCLVPSSNTYNNSHNLFSLKGVEEGHVPLSKHFECDIEVGGQVVHRVGILVKKDKIPLIDSKGRKAKTPALLRSNLIRIMLNEFCELHGEECIRLFECPAGISPLWFSTLCLYYFAHVPQKAGVGASSVKTMIPVMTKTKVVINQTTLRPITIRVEVIITVKQSLDKIQAKANSVKLVKENNVVKSLTLWEDMLAESWSVIKDNPYAFQQACQR